MKVCPKCGHEIVCPDINCPWCGCKLENDFSLFCFIKENCQYFEAIGIIATIIALLPIFGDAVMGTGWQYDKSNLSIGPFVFTIILSIAIVVGISFIILFKLFDNNRRDETPFFNYDQETMERSISKKILFALFKDFKKDDWKRCGFFLIFFSFIIAFAVFLFLSLIQIKNDVGYFIIFFTTVFFILLILFILYVLIVVFYIKIISKAQLTLSKNKFRAFVVVLGCLTIGIMVILVFSPSTLDVSKFFQKSKYPSNVSLDFDNQLYFDPQISTTNGIPLIPTNISENNLPTLPYWRTNFGYFVSETFPDKKIRIEGTAILPRQDMINVKKKIYWAYSPKYVGTPKQNVSISFGAIPFGSNEPISNVSVVIVWIDNDTAYVDVNSIKMANYPFIPANNSQNHSSE
jgi:membrane protease YdiL (CAAX protease family)